MRVVLIDDEAPARAKLKQMLEREEDLEIIGEAANGLEAVMLIERERPDVAFLDIQMPKMDGFETLSCLKYRPLIVFATAYDQFAIRAFEQSATDYLLKPFDKERLDMTLTKVRQSLGGPPVFEPLIDAWKNRVRSERRYLKRMVSRVGDRILIVKPARVLYIAAEHGETVAFTGDREFILDESLDSLETLLDPDVFVRIHRGTIVNVDHVQEILRRSGGKMSVVLNDTRGTKLQGSRTGTERLRQLLGL